MSTMDLLTPLRDFNNLLRVVKRPFDFSRKVFGITEFKVDQRLVVEIVGNAWGTRSNDGFAQRQIFKNSSWRIEFSEYVSLVGNNSQITFLDCLSNLFAHLRSEVSNRYL